MGYHSLLQGNLPGPWVEPGSPALQADSLMSEPPGNPAWNTEFCLTHKSVTLASLVAVLTVTPI